MEEYDIVDAFNYNTYRPPLHQPILSQCLKNHRFNLALDVGCGVGNSSLGLTHFCRRVIGYDISKAMLKKAIKHKKINYISTKPNIEYDLLCFFGTLNYIDKNEVTEFIQNLSPKGKIICCDFKINYESILNILKIYPSELKYNYQKNLSDYNLNFNLLKSKITLLKFECDISELSHLMFSEANIKKELEKKGVGQKKFHQILIDELNNFSSSKKIIINSEAHYSLYNNQI